MNRIILIIGAALIVAGAYPTQAHQLITQMALWLGNITTNITPTQQTAIIIVIVALLFYRK